MLLVNHIVLRRLSTPGICQYHLTSLQYASSYLNGRKDKHLTDTEEAKCEFSEQEYKN